MILLFKMFKINQKLCNVTVYDMIYNYFNNINRILYMLKKNTHSSKGIVSVDFPSFINLDILMMKRD